MATWRRRHDQRTCGHEFESMARPPQHWKPNPDHHNGYMHDQSRFSSKRVDAGGSYGQEATKWTQRRPPRYPNRECNDTLSFENNFCWIVGGMSPKRFEDAKKYIHLSDKVMQWNDSAAKEAFFDSKARLWAEFRNYPPYISLPSPDIYIDNVDWNSDNETEGLDDQFISISDVEADTQEVEGNNVFPASFYIPLDQIKATGWDDY